jgi:hypothetical protein
LRLAPERPSSQLSRLKNGQPGSNDWSSSNDTSGDWRPCLAVEGCVILERLIGPGILSEDEEEHVCLGDGLAKLGHPKYPAGDAQRRIEQLPPGQLGRQTSADQSTASLSRPLKLRNTCIEAGPLRYLDYRAAPTRR